jgi:hypothetical protein
MSQSESPSPNPSPERRGEPEGSSPNPSRVVKRVPFGQMGVGIPAKSARSPLLVMSRTGV